jgi:serine/threonine protein kinase
MIGTPAYMSPRQAAGQVELLGPPDDIYGLGATLYTLLTGAAPVSGSDAAEVLEKVREGDWVPPRQFDPTIPEALDWICRKAMALDPGKRHKTVLELATDIELWLADAVPTRGSSFLSLEWLLGRERRTRSAVLLAALILAVGILVTVLAGVLRSSEPPRQSEESARDNNRQVGGQAAKQEDPARVKQSVVEWSVQLTLRGHAGPLRAVCFSPDGSRIVSGSEDETVKVWDAHTGQETLTLKGHTGTVQSVAFSPDGQRIVSGSWDQTLKMWDAQTGRETCTLKGHGWAVTGVAFSPDGKRIVSASWDQTVKVWDAQLGHDTSP